MGLSRHTYHLLSSANHLLIEGIPYARHIPAIKATVIEDNNDKIAVGRVTR